MLRKLVVLALLVAVAGWTMTALAGDAQKAPYMHVVIFQVKKDAPKGTKKAMIEDSHKLLEKIPTVKQLWVGRPAKMGTPDLASKDYDIALTIAFENYDGLKSYIDHDMHKQFVEKHKANIEK